ncbi:MAG: NtaA/DmoA family FMN-dependent monooxygenase [Polyangiales bacterium]
MAQRRLKLGAVLTGVGTTQSGWRHPNVPADASVSIAWYQQQAQKAEAAKLDFVFIVDSPYITPDSAPHFLNRLEPLTLLSAVAAVTSRIGLVATATTSYNEPFNLARAFASLDLISGGRAGWNVVTTGLEGAAGNYGREQHYPHALRYRRAAEHLAVVRALWDSYEDDAFPRDKERGVFLDRDKQHRLDHRGEFFSVAGPLNIARSPQGQPVIFQAGGSEDGRDLAARSADAIFASAESFEEALAFANDLRTRAAAAGRVAPQIFPGIVTIVADTDAEAEAIQDARLGKLDLAKALAQLGRPFNYYDFLQHDLDAPFPDLGDLGSNGYRSHAERIKRIARDEGLTLRQAALRFVDRRSPFVGAPETVARELVRWFEAGAVDGFNIGVDDPTELDVFITRVLPILRARGVVQTEYAHATLRENLGLSVPENRHTAARRETTARGESLHQHFRDLHAHRVATMDPAKLKVNVDQRRTLVETADRAGFVKEGDVLAPFTLEEVDGATLTRDALLREGPLVLVFFRFEGCPACNIALPYYQRTLLPELRALGARLVAVSPQRADRLIAIKQRHALGFEVASDRDNALGRALGILYTFDEASQQQSRASGRPIGEVTGTGTWELPMPTVVVVDRAGRVRFADVHPDWLVRTEAGPVLEAVRNITAQDAARPQVLTAPVPSSTGSHENRVVS